MKFGVLAVVPHSHLFSHVIHDLFFLAYKKCIVKSVSVIIPRKGFLSSCALFIFGKLKQVVEIIVKLVNVDLTVVGILNILNIRNILNILNIQTVAIQDIRHILGSHKIHI
jgi:hypothetical protein